MIKTKYRAWDKEHNEMFIVSRIMWSSDGKTMTADNSIHDGELFTPSTRWSDDVMQYTRYHDKDGVECYAGDVIEFFICGKPRYGAIKMVDGMWSIVNGNNEFESDLWDCVNNYNCRIVGNLYVYGW